MQIGELLLLLQLAAASAGVVRPLEDSSVAPTGFLRSIKECMREMLSVRSRCPVTQAAWDRGLPPPPKKR